MLKLPRIRPALLVLSLASAALAQSRGPVVPNFQQPDAQQPAPAAAPAVKADDVDLVGPTESQKKRAQAAAEAKVRAEADAKARAEAEARVAAEAKVRAEAEARARVEAQARALAEAKLKAEAEAQAQARVAAEAKRKADAEAQARLEAEARAAVEARARIAAEVQAKARAEAEARVIAEARAKFAAEEQARAEAQAKQRAQDEARVAAEARRRQEREDAAARAQQQREDAAATAQQQREDSAARAQQQRGDAETRRQKQRDEAAARASAAVEAKARAHAEAVEKARVRAMAQARRNDEARCSQKKSKKLQGDCRAMVAAKYEPAPIGLPEPALALAPLIASPPDRFAQSSAAAAPSDRRAPLASDDRRVLAPSSDRRAIPAVAHDDRAAGVRVASATSEPAAPALANSFTPVPRDDPSDARSRHAEVRNDLQVGPQSLVLNHLEARAEIAPESLQAGFTYRVALDDAGAAHHLFGASLSSARCPDDAGCGVRWFGFAGISPSASQAYSVQRGVGGNTTSHTDSLGWSSFVGATGVSYAGRLLSFAADGQLEALSIDYTSNTEPGGTHNHIPGTLDQLRLRGTAGIASGPWSGSLRLAGYVYSGTAPETFQLVPLRGALVDDDTAGLASAPQSFQARLEGRYDATSGLSLSASYGYLSYVGPHWSSANLLAANVSQRFGRFRVGFGLVYEGETDSSGNGSPTLFGTGTLGASF